MKLQEIEEIRINCKKKNYIGLLLIILAAVFIFLAQLELDFAPVFVGGGFISMITGIIFVAIANIKFSKIKKEFKYKYLKEEIKRRYPEIDYFPERGFEKDFVNRLGFYPNPDRYHSEDMVCGKIKGVSFVCADVKMEEKHVQHTKNGTRTYYVTIFQGRIYRFDFNKPFKDSILLTEGMRPSKYHYLNKVEMESIEFNKKFNTFCKDKLNAFYVLTPKMMLALLDLEKTNRGAITMLINENNVFMGIYNNRDAFELRMNTKLDDNFIDYYLQDIIGIEGIIDQLDLDNQVFKDIYKDVNGL